MANTLVQELERPVESVEIIDYVWSERSRVPVKPGVAAVEVKAIHRANGKVTPELVVARAKAADNPLHPAFEWDDQAAAEIARDTQARYLMRSLLVVYKKPSGELTPPTRYLVHLTASVEDPALDAATEDATQPKVYLPVRQVMSEADHRRRYRDQAWRELVQWRQRYRDIAELAAIFDAIDAQAKQKSA